MGGTCAPLRRLARPRLTGSARNVFGVDDTHPRSPAYGNAACRHIWSDDDYGKTDPSSQSSALATRNPTVALR